MLDHALLLSSLFIYYSHIYIYKLLRYLRIQLKGFYAAALFRLEFDTTIRNDGSGIVWDGGVNLDFSHENGDLL